MAKQQLPPDDNRLGQIKEGAGLEDSRINQEFVDFLRKWSTPVLLVAAAIVLGYFLYNKRIEAREARIAEAFTQFNQSSTTFSPSPDALRRIADDFEDVKGVHIMATLAAADEYLNAVQRGVRPGTPLSAATNEPESAEDFLTPEESERFLNEAETLYRSVYDETQGAPALAIHTLGALYGLAAVSESRGDIDAARNVLDQAASLARQVGYVEHVAIAQQRIESLSEVRTVTLPSKADLPQPTEPEPVAAPAGEPAPEGPTLPPADGEAPPAGEGQTEGQTENQTGGQGQGDGGDQTGQTGGDQSQERSGQSGNDGAG